MNDVSQTPETIFGEAIEISSRQGRALFLDGACQGNADLRREVEKLVEDHFRAGGFLESPAPGLAATTDSSPFAEEPGTVIGPYKLLQQIGEGGMGVVFMAEQTEPLQRTVALKIIKPGMDTRQVFVRFEAERQALAMMDHPNIAKVLDAGTTGGSRDEGLGTSARNPDPLALDPRLSTLDHSSGRPYFVMELVKGVPITKYCDERHLPLRARLELFTQVCRAVQHAHQKGVIHRDIKPSNILVAEYDDQAIPKVIDFGVAKATAQRLTERTMFTELGQVVGTMEYMSPEQAKLNQLDIDTRSDIYSLGVLLYELLAGSTPFEGKRLHEAAFDEMLRIIREEEPPKPSTRISSSDTLPSIAASRQTEPARLSNEVRGELDWIVMKALEKDRNRRYETAGGLAQDIGNYLANEPVQACPPSAGYRLRKFARRNKAALTAASLVAVALLLGLIGTTRQAIRATRAERAIVVERDHALEAEKEAKNEAAIAKAVNDFLNDDLLGQAKQALIPYDTYMEPTNELKLLTVLDRAAEKLDGRFPDKPLVEAALQQTIAASFLNISEDNANRAVPHLQRAVKLREENLGLEHPDTLTSMRSLATAKGDPDLMARVLELQRRLLGNDDPVTLKTIFGLAFTSAKRGKTAQAIALHREVLEAQRRVLGEDHPDTAWTMNCLAHALVWSAGRPGIPKADDREIESLYRHALAVTRKVRGESWYTYDVIQRLGEFLNSRHRYEEAEALLQEAILRMQALPGASPAKTAELSATLSKVYQDWGKPERAAEWEQKSSPRESEEKEASAEIK